MIFCSYIFGKSFGQKMFLVGDKNTFLYTKIQRTKEMKDTLTFGRQTFQYIFQKL